LIVGLRHGTMKRIPSCPQCGVQLNEFIVDFENERLLCPRCERAVLPTTVFTNSTVNYLAPLIPEEHRDAFLAALGFQRRAMRRTPRPLVWFLTLLISLGAVPCILLQDTHPITKALAFLCVPLIVFELWRLYREEETPKWRKAKPKKELNIDAVNRAR
jgi:hypothetical protein